MVLRGATLTDNDDMHQRLQHWADWALTRYDNGLGYPRQAIEAELIRMGGVLIRGSGLRLPQVDAYAEETDNAVRELPEPMRSAITLQYLFNKSAEAKAIVLTMRMKAIKPYSKRDYFRFCENGRVWLAGYFAIKEKKRRVLQSAHPTAI